MRRRRRSSVSRVSMRSLRRSQVSRVSSFRFELNDLGFGGEGLRRREGYQEGVAENEAQRGQREGREETKGYDGDDEEEEDEGEHEKREPEGARDVGDEV
jgi:hypothetical protein